VERRALPALIDAFIGGSVDFLSGPKPGEKALDVQEVRLVGVVSADIRSRSRTSGPPSGYVPAPGQGSAGGRGERLGER